MPVSPSRPKFQTQQNVFYHLTSKRGIITSSMKNIKSILLSLIIAIITIAVMRLGNSYFHNPNSLLPDLGPLWLGILPMLFLGFPIAIAGTTYTILNRTRRYKEIAGQTATLIIVWLILVYLIMALPNLWRFFFDHDNWLSYPTTSQTK